MEINQIMSAIFLIAVLVLILPGFLSTNNKFKQFFKEFIYLDYNYFGYYCNYLHNNNEKNQFIITGCMGRMGQQIIKSTHKNKEFKLVSLTESRVIKKNFRN